MATSLADGARWCCGPADRDDGERGGEDDDEEEAARAAEDDDDGEPERAPADGDEDRGKREAGILTVGSNRFLPDKEYPLPEGRIHD